MRPTAWRTLAGVLLVTLAATSCGSGGTDRVSRAADREDAALARQLDAFAAERAAAGQFAGVVLLARRGEVLLHAGYGLADRERGEESSTRTRFDIASLGKMFTAVAVAQLVERGQLSYDDVVGRHLPGLRNPAVRDRVKIHHLLTHTSGIPDLPEPLFTEPPAALAGYLPFLEGAALEFEPGAQRSYSNSGFVVAGLIVEAVAGESYESYLERHVFDRAGMAGASLEPDSPRSAAIGYDRRGEGSGGPPLIRSEAQRQRGGPHGGTYATAYDLHRFFTALWGGRLLDDAAVQTMTTPREGAAAAYGFGVLEVGADRLVGHSGGDAGASADAYHYPRSGYTIVVLSNVGPPASHEVAGHGRRLVEARLQ